MAGRMLGVAESEPVLDAVTVNGNSKLGDAAADLVGFHGSTGTSQATFLTQQSINALSVSGVIGFTTSASLSRLVEKVNSILTILAEHGLKAAS